MADRRSALEGTAKPVAGTLSVTPGIAIAEKTCRELVQVASWPNTLGEAGAALGRLSGLGVPMRTGTTASDSGLAILCVGPGRWWLAGPRGLHERLRQAVAIEVSALTDLGHAYTIIRVSGPRVLDLMAKGPAIDFENGFAPGSVARSTIHHMGVTIFRPSIDCFELFVYRGFARSLWHWAIDSAEEFGLRVEETGEYEGMPQS